MSIDTPYAEMDAAKQRIAEEHGESVARMHFSQANDTYAAARQLVGEIESLMARLEREKADLLRDPLTATPNSLGIVQGHSSAIESAVGRFVAAKDALRRMEVALGINETGFLFEKPQTFGI